MSNQIKTLKEKTELTPTITPSSTPTVTPTSIPIFRTTIEPSPGTVPAVEPQGKQKALIEIENKMANLKAGIQKYMQDYENLKNTPYADIPLNAAKNLQSQYNDLEKERWEILSQ